MKPEDWPSRDVGPLKMVVNPTLAAELNTPPPPNPAPLGMRVHVNLLRPEMKPESFVTLPLYAADRFIGEGECRTLAETWEHLRGTKPEVAALALVTMCNAYPLALALAEAVSAYNRTDSPDDCAAVARALAAFLAHRQEDTK